MYFICRDMIVKQFSVLFLFSILHLHPVPADSLISYELNSTNWFIKFQGYVGDQVKIQLMPGIYDVHKNVLITNVSNLTIEGDSSSGSCITFSCSNLSSWIITNSSFIEIKNIRFLNCGNTYDTQKYKDTVTPDIKAAMFVYNVTSIMIFNVTIENSCGYGIIALNIIGTSMFEYMTIHGNDTLSTFCDIHSNDTIFGGIALLNLETEDNVTLQKHVSIININHCLFFNIEAIWNDEIIDSIDYFNSSIIGIVFYQAQYHVDVNINNTNITNITNAKRSIISISYSMNNTSNVTIANSLISYVNANYCIIEINHEGDTNATNTTFPKFMHALSLNSCDFFNNKVKYVLRMKTAYNGSMVMLLNNNTFDNNTVKDYLFDTKAVAPVISGYLKFTSNVANIVFQCTNYVLLEDGAEFSFTNNSHNPRGKLKYTSLFKKNSQSSLECPFQFTNNTNVNIRFLANNGYYRTIYGNPLFGCDWIPSFPNREHELPSEIFDRIIQSDGVDNEGISGWENSVCPCNNNGCLDQNCLETDNVYAHPGETITISLMHRHFDIAMYTDFNESKFNAIAPPCGIYLKNITTDLIFNYCTMINYTIAISSTQNKTCLLLLKTATKENTLYAFRVHLSTCTLGFVLKDGICKCDPNFVSRLNGLECDISNQEFQRPPSSWIGTNTKVDDIIFTKDCRLNYCVQDTAMVHLSNPDTQCLSGRSGIACGECAQGLSAVFGTSKCKKCTNYWLFLIPAFALAGLLLVLVLFVFNLTVVDGDINGFILMVSGLSIHSSRVFPSTYGASWVLVSLCNLDLGFEVCFYNGMTSYAATWLSFIFPVYVLLIVAAMAFASRYYQVIEKITRRRAIPVIATVYLLSYSKIMQVTFRGLFSYTTVYHLYADNKEYYWGMDSSVPLFGFQFSLLFVFCSIIFLFLIIPTNVLLISGKTVYRFKLIVVYLKPFLDACEAPFKEHCRYILGLELLLRAIIFAITSLDAQNTAAIYSGVLFIYTVYICQVMPFKSRFNSIIYSLYLVYMSAFIILFTRYYPSMPEIYAVLLNTVIYLGFAQFMGIIGIHIWKYNLRHYTVFARCERYIISTYQQNISRNSYYRPQRSITLSTERYENFRDELLAI